MITLAVTVSYLIYDLVCSAFDKKVNVDNSVHHVVCIVGLGAGLAYERVSEEVFVFKLQRGRGMIYDTVFTLVLCCSVGQRWWLHYG